MKLFYCRTLIALLLTTPLLNTYAFQDPDDTFGIQGKLTIDFGNSDNQCNALILQPDGKIILGGYTWDGSASRFALVRLMPDGSPDNSFGDHEKVTTQIGAYDDEGWHAGNHGKN